MFLNVAMAPSDAITVLSAFSDARIAAKDKRADASDEDLMQGYRRGDSDAFTVLYGRYRERLFRFLLRLTCNSAEGEEVFQETWMAVIRGRGRFRSDSRFATYLFSIARRRAADRWRNRDNAVLETLAEIEHPILDEALIARFGPLEDVQNVALRSALSDAIAGLPLPQREAFLMQAEGDLSLAEIAQATQTNLETVKSRLRYATRRLRECLADWRCSHE